MGAGVERDAALDAVKVIGLVGIVIAHTDPPGWLFQARNFGVPTMAVLAGAVFALGQARRPLTLGPYLRRRTVQLVVPVWTFLAITIPTLHLVAALTGRHRTQRWDPLWRSAALLNGPYGNPWVVRVFLLCSLTAPAWYALRRRWPSPRAGLTTLLAVYLAYEGACWAWAVHGRHATWLQGILVQDVVLFAVGFGIAFALGVRLHDLDDRALLALAAVLGAGLVGFFLVRGAWVGTQRWKYPPRFPYLAYALAVGLTMIAVARRWPPVQRFGAHPVVRMASSASLWAYLWHGFWLLVWDQARWPDRFLVEAPANVALSLASLWLMQTVVRRLLALDLGGRSRWFLTTAFAVR